MSISNIKPILNNFIFQFLDGTQDGRFINRTQSGIILTNKNDQEQTANPRWATVLAIGPDVEEFAVNDIVLIGAGRWSQYFTIDGTKYWKSDSNEVLAVTTDIQDTYSY